MSFLRAAILPVAIACLFAAGVIPARAAEPAAPEPAPGNIVITGYVTTEKVIFLTFDDGPFAPWTQQILDVLAEYDAHATFFIIGRQAAVDPAILQTIHDGGNGIGNHAYNHANLSGVSWDTFAYEVGSTADVLGDLDNKCLRPPYGAIDANTLDFAQEYGYTVVKWNMDPRDWAQPGARAIANHVIQHAQPGSIVVMHDGGGDRSQTVDALRILIPTLQKQGYVFKALCRDVSPEELVLAAGARPTTTPEPVVTYALTPAPTPTPAGHAVAVSVLRAMGETPDPEAAAPPLPLSARPPGRSPLVPDMPVPTSTRLAIAITNTPLPVSPAAEAEGVATPEPTPEQPVYGGISFPRAGSTIRGPVLVQGFADHPEFEKWQLDLVLGNGQVIFLALGETPLPTIDKLVVWDTRLYASGAVMLRLRVVHHGNYEEYFTQLTVAN